MTTRSVTPPGTASECGPPCMSSSPTGPRRALRAALDLEPAKVEVLIKLTDGPMTCERSHAPSMSTHPPRPSASTSSKREAWSIARPP